MAFGKQHKLGIVLLLVLLAAGSLCIYAVWRDGNAAVIQNRSGPENSLPGDMNRRPEIPDQSSGGQFPHPNLTAKPDRTSSPGPPPNANQETTQQTAPPGGRLPVGTAKANASGVKCAPGLVAYAAIFLGLFLAGYWLLINKKVRVHPGDEAMLIVGLLGIGLLLRISAATLMEGHPFDIGLFKMWATAAANNLPRFYSNSGSCDYPPLYIYVLFLIGRIASLPALSPYFTLLLKLPSMAADIATAYLVYRLARKYHTPEIGIMLAAFYAFNPAVVINSIFWGQVDSFFTLMVVASLCLLAENRIGLAAALFATAVMMKPQGIIFLPVLGFELIRQKSFRKILGAMVCALSTALVITLPFSLNNGVLWIFRLFANTLSEYPYASVNAFNLFGLLGANYRSDAATLFLFSYHAWGLIFIVMITALAWFIYVKGNSRAFAPAAALLLIAGVFIFGARMHERYLFPAVALAILAFIYLGDRRLLLPALGFSATSYVNTQVVLFETLRGINAASYGPALIGASVLNVLLFTYLVKVLFDIAVLKKNCTFSKSCLKVK